ncbi:hypothetical protein BO94DRAFT_178437 [Aspergillus sclerotioniger CBS 115572]|uniref:SAM and PH domain protein n=1 Tax=Aspergillus sclerotioniger CBS 115572 TaxID=1450535 RepID=A0A317VVW1_9EURO|nr:hypothetical protein BO94DRAFT_178437 [Aspergillus sclerotioniger CBS 115572]PWY78474.1 hypothetical protein BO94DRAFT_178437 [Aspergillus sclerotioniger CBS 115572]
MQARRTRRKAPPASLDMTNTKKFQPAFTVVKARQSATTDFDDTDFEYSESDDESPRMSMGSFGYDSVSSASTPELPTPDHAPREPFAYYRKSTQGPSGPHLFRSSIVSTSSVPSTEIDLYFERSPRRSEFQSDLDTPQFPPSDVETPLPTDVETLYTGSNIGSARFPRSNLGTPYYPPSDVEAPQYTGSSVASSQFSRSKLGTSHYPASDIEAPPYTGSSVGSSRFPRSNHGASHYPASDIEAPQYTGSSVASSRSQFPRSNFGASHYPESDSDAPQHTGSSIGGTQFPMSDVGTSHYIPSDFEAPQHTGSSVGSSQFPRSNFEAPQHTGSSVGSSQFPRSNFDAPQHTGSSIGSTQIPGSDVSSSRRYAFSPCTPQAYKTVHPDVSQVEESEIRGWAPSQVAHWMHIAGYDESVIDRFIINDIAGNVLLNLRADDLKELGIQSFGKRHQLMASIDHLRNTMLKSPPSRDREPSLDRESSRRQSYAASVSPTGEVISRQPNGNQLTETEAVSIVGIEQVLPKPHNCSKGESCPKYRRYKRQMEKLAAEYPDAVLVPGQSIVTGNPGNPETAQNMLRPKSDTEPSVVASSDVLGVVTPRLSEEALNEIRKLDPQEKMRQFFSYQHLEHSSDSDSDSDSESDISPAPPVPPKVAPNVAAPFLPPPATRTNNMTANLRSLPKLVIPTDSDSDDLTTAVTAQRTITPSMASRMYGSPTVVQEYGPFSNARNMPPVDYYRQGTPFTEVDVPVTAQMDGPIARETSQSVPPDMRYGNFMRARYPGPISRSPSVRAHPGMALRRVKEDKPLTPIDDPADLKRSPRIGHKTGNNSVVANLDPDVTRSGYMRKRKPARFLRHDWQEAHFTLRGTNLAMHRDEYAALRRSRALDEIDVEDYAVACSALASSSKLTAAFKKSILRNGNNPGKGDAAFTFSLVPASKENEKKMLFGNKDIKSHHFAVRTRDERIDWMRDMMLAKALKKGRDDGYEMRPEGNFI